MKKHLIEGVIWGILMAIFQIFIYRFIDDQHVIFNHIVFQLIIWITAGLVYGCATFSIKVFASKRKKENDINTL